MRLLTGATTTGPRRSFKFFRALIELGPVNLPGQLRGGRPFECAAACCHCLTTTFPVNAHSCTTIHHLAADSAAAIRAFDKSSRFMSLTHHVSSAPCWGLRHSGHTRAHMISMHVSHAKSCTTFSSLRRGLRSSLVLAASASDQANLPEVR